METVELIAVGDMSLICPKACDPFEHVGRYLRAGDLLFGNLETALCDTGVTVEKEVALGVSPRQAEYLSRTGFDVVSVANNHILDCGPRGLSQTLAALREHGVRFVGAGDNSSPQGYEIIECRGLKVAFLAYCENGASGLPDGAFVNQIDRPVILEQLHALKGQCDVVAVSLHWGIEYVFYPSPWQIELAHDLIRSGAALVLGHHSHVVQGIEQLEKGLIVYSLGSFQFQPRREEARPSFILHARISPQGVERYKLVPTRIGDADRPQLSRNKDRREILGLVERISAPIREGRVTDRWWFEQAAPVYLRVNLKAWMTRVRKYGFRHLVQFARWLVCRFTIKCYLGYLRAMVGQHG
jgi:poly-gamma-glutamate capsule biosynthesis protein CapA/YwtB (metallophosphatase superfamily)